jgi:aspartyl-tRNA(Asn)/glutamyl-tRNA(Gln) amidotransferase subunit B
VCLGLPGALPVINAQAILFGLQMALAFDADVPPRSTFARKNYFYPDNPKAVPDLPVRPAAVHRGRLGDVRLTRIHLEEDAAKLVHVGESGRIHGSAASVVDFNRGGTPLAEMVTEPDLRSASRRASGSPCCARRCAGSGSPT